MPDQLRIERSLSEPELGPRLLFFSGGTALNGIAQSLKRYTHNSVHLVTPFDSGGSSQALRKAFDMPAIGDLRSRLMALADETVLGHPDIFRLFTHRFEKGIRPDLLLSELDGLVGGTHPLVSAIEQPMRSLIVNQLTVFRDAKPDDFDLSGASVGNLILAGGYLSQQHQLEPIIFLVAKLVGVRGIVRAVVDDNLHLGAELDNGSRIIGQHLITGKEHAPLPSPIRRIFLNGDASRLAPASAIFSDRNANLVQTADLICFPPGSFYSSVLANLLPAGVGSAIAGRKVPKVYIPSLGHDPEAADLDVIGKVDKLVDAMRQDAGPKCPVPDLLNFVVLDEKTGESNKSVSARLLERGIMPIWGDLVSETSDPFYDPGQICDVLISLT
ncbi:GAK system CofD-like protein [Roseibium sp. RKSG952]|uniref:GAK system CofD-like protein n=1 Tax=Roseibium sp. RKSG952 TaxID=2529384 RepID=UPI001AD8B858|nr:GAK system CofD-like protein [Roseibium sp. RKSG952]